ncbi:MAG: hypothetical protein L3K18_03650 [Thermoplasmata archaeon]|nr:hypothetical protein [Thermoplasmata archaeon]MCI4356226.1 hypothetical protein [Thermoplasmata archaeon]
MVYLVGFLIDVKGLLLPFAFDAVVLAPVVAIVVLTSRWWDPAARPLGPARRRLFLVLAGLALLLQILGVIAESGASGDLANNAPGLLLLAVLFLNCFG